MDEGSHLTVSHYDILGAPDNAEYAEIKSKYRAAILALHPDKLSSTNGGQVLQALTSAVSDSLRGLWPLTNEENFIPHNKVKSTIKDFDVEDHPFNWSPTVRNSGESRIGEGDVLVSRFLRVQKAWEVLRDAEARAKYDNYLRTERLAYEMKSTRIIGDEIHLRDMECRSVDLDHGKEVEYSYPCRCGDYIVLSQEELEMAGVEFKEELSQSACGENRAGSESHRPRSNSLVLPCQSCSMHLRLLFFSSHRM